MKPETTETKEHIYPRFYRSRYPRSFGSILSSISLFLIIMNILAMIQDKSIILIIITIIFTILLFGLLAIGLLAIIASMQKIRISEEGVQFMLGGLVMKRIAAKDLRSVVATTREYRDRMKDKDIYLMQLFWNGRHPQNFGMYFQWSSETEAAFREKLPHVKMLM